MKTIPSRFFILGSQRSGTNLMRLILDSHPNAWVFGEPTAHWLLDNNYIDDLDKAIERWVSKIHSKNRRQEIFKNIREIRNKEIKYFGYTTPGWTELFLEYNCIKEKLKNIPKIIFMLRNPFDVISSIVKLKEFASTTIKTMELWMTDNNRSFNSRYSHLLHKNDELWKIRWFSVYWNYKTQAYFDMQQSKDYKVIGIKYEDLCTCPKNTISKVCSFLDMSWSDDLLCHEKKQHFETVRNVTNGGTKVNKSIFKTSVDKRETTYEEKEIILSINENLIAMVNQNSQNFTTKNIEGNTAEISVSGVVNNSNLIKENN